MQRPPPFTITLQIPPPRTPKAAGSSSAGNGKNVAPAPRRCNRSIIVGTAAPHQCPHPTKPPSTSVAFLVTLFFVTLQFSDLVPYVAILKTFHIKKSGTYDSL